MNKTEHFDPEKGGLTNRYLELKDKIFCIEKVLEEKK